MEEHEWLAQRFDAHRTHLRAVAYRKLGSISEAEDALQEAWLRLSRSDTSRIENLGGWLTTVVGRVCLDMLRSRRSRRDGPFGVPLPEPILSRADGIDPEHEALTFAKFVRSARTRPALVNGVAGIVSWSPDGRPFSVMGFTVRGGKIVEIEVIADPERLSRLDLALLDN